MPYSILYPIDGATYSGTFADAYADVSYPYQVSSFGVAYEQVEDMAHRIHQVALDTDAHPLVIQGYVVMARDIDTAPSQPEKVGPDLFSVVERFRFAITPQ